MQNSLTAISLFTSGGIGDLAVRSAGFEILVSNEIEADRHSVFAHNFPTVHCLTGNVWGRKQEIVEATRKLLNGRPLDLLYATPPCQGMSKNGRGKLLNAIRAGRKPIRDVRNRLIIPTIELAKELRPEIILLENVPEMGNTVILDDHGEAVAILNYLQRELGSDYCGRAEVVEFADYGVPQCRQRLITVFTRAESLKKWFNLHGTFLPIRTHSERGTGKKRRWVTLREVIGTFPPLDAKDERSATSPLPYHRVPVLDAMKYWWVQHTLPERSAFDNQCVSCRFQDNPSHGAKRDGTGINRASSETPLYCLKCGELLPRPSVLHQGKRRLMHGFTSAYKRMPYDKPASALTRNLSYACSDNKLHPVQNRVLSLYEAFRIHTIDQFEYQWQRSDGRKISDKLIREIIGESIPPAGLKVIVDHLVNAYLEQIDPTGKETESTLFAFSS